MFCLGEFYEWMFLKSCICVRWLKFIFKYGGYKYLRKVLICEKMVNISLLRIN